MAKTIKRHDEYECMRAERRTRKSIKKRNKERRAERRERNKEYTTRYEIGTCGRKRRYPSKVAAENSAEYLKYMHEGKILYPYHCVLCDGWHLTSHPRMDPLASMCLASTRPRSLGE